MKVLHIGINTFPNLAPERAFRECGHQVVSVDHTDSNRINAAMNEAIRTGDVDLMFMQLQGPNLVTPRKVEQVRDTGALVVNWTGDVREPLPQHYIDLAPHVSVTAFTNFTDVDTMRAMGFDARFLQVGYDEHVYRLDGPRAAPHDVVFMGNNYGSRFPLSVARFDMVEHLRAKLGSRFAVYGKGWGNTKRLAPYDEAAVYRSARVAINFDHFDRPGFYSDRYLRSRACGCFTIDATRMPLDGIVGMCEAAKTSDEMSEAIAQEVYDNDRWHNRVKILEQWVRQQ